MEEIREKRAKELMEELINLCKEEGITGKNGNVGGYYVSFVFRQSCKECGKPF